jgi:hypothetical protein
MEAYGHFSAGALFRGIATNEDFINDFERSECSCLGISIVTLLISYPKAPCTRIG